MIKNIR